MNAPRRVLICVVGAVSLAGGGYAFGRFKAPAKVVEVEDTRAKAEIKELREQLETAKIHKVKETVTVFVDGKPATRTEREDTHVDRTIGTRTEVDTVTDTHTVKSKTTESGPEWMVGALVVALPRLDPLGLDLSIGATVSHRIAGPVWLGLSATVPLAQPLSVPAVGLSLSVTF